MKTRRLILSTDGIPRYWFLGSALLTHMTNAMFVVFPEGERYFVRQARRALKYVRRRELLPDVESFIAQEAQHAREHQRCFASFEAHGLPLKSVVAHVATLLHFIDQVFSRHIKEPDAAKLTMALVAAFEHYTASWGELIFRDLSALDEMDPRMRDLLLWHFAEELEHKHVAFEMLRDLSDSYTLRALGMCAATIVLSVLLSLVTCRFLLADEELTLRQLAVDVSEFLRHPDNLLISGFKSFLRYQRPGFHPDDIAHPEAARMWLAEIKAAGRAKTQPSQTSTPL